LCDKQVLKLSHAKCSTLQFSQPKSMKYKDKVRELFLQVINHVHYTRKTREKS
jgi:hypothetical protein